jgi:hypothetical protein
MNSFFNWRSALAEDAAKHLKRSSRGRKNRKGNQRRRQRLLASPHHVEALETRRLLTALPNSDTITGQLQEYLQQGGNVPAEIQYVENNVFSSTSNLPLIGSYIATGQALANTVFTNLGNTIKTNVLGGLTGTPTGTAVQNAFSAALGHSLPSGSVSVALIDTTNTPGSTTPNQVDINLTFTGNLFSAAVNPSFDIGLPGLGLKFNGTVNANVAYNVSFGLVVSVAPSTPQGFYINLPTTPVASLVLSVNLSNGASGSGSLGFFQLNATNGTAAGTTQLVGTISLNLSVGGATPTILTPASALSLVANSSLSANAEADVHLHAVLSFANASYFPSLASDIDITWSLANASLGADSSGKIGVSSSVFGSKPTIQFNNIALDLGTFFTNFLNPILVKVQAALAPVQPLIKLLGQPAPIFNDLHLADLDGNGTTTVLEVLEFFIGEKSPGTVEFINAVLAANALINSLPTNTANLSLPLGSFQVGGSNSSSSDLRGTGANLSDASMSSSAPDDVNSELTTMGNSNSSLANFMTALNAPALAGGTGPEDGGGFKIPLLESPTMVFNLLLGQNVDLFTFDTPTLDFNPHFDFSFAPIEVLPFIKVTFGGAADFKAHLEMGYDTQGLSDFAKDNFASTSALDLLNGFYVDDDPTETYAQASLTLSVALGIDIGIASANVSGGVTGTVDFTIYDSAYATDGGKIRASTIVTEIATNPLSLFNINGTISASFDLNAQFLGIPYTYNLATIQLASFSITPTAPAPPPLGSVDGNGILTLNIGSGAQNFNVADVSDSGGLETVAVSSNGITQNFSGVKGIVGTCGNGTDAVTVGCVSPVTLTGGPGDDTLMVGPNENATITGGAGNDYLGALSPNSPSTGALTVSSNESASSSDTLVGGGGNDHLQDNGSGTALIEGGGGTDTLVAGSGTDTLSAGHNTGTGYESLTGGSGVDTFIADNSGDPSGLGGPQDLIPGGGRNLLQYDNSDKVGTPGLYDTEVDQGQTVLQNGVKITPPVLLSSTVKLPTQTYTYTGVRGDIFGKYFNASSVVDTATGTALPTTYLALDATGPDPAVEEPGTYNVSAYYYGALAGPVGGDLQHAPSSASVTGGLTILPATPTIAVNSTINSFDGDYHRASITATGPSTQDLSYLLQVTYKNQATGVTSSIQPLTPGTYEVYAAFPANADYNAIANYDTGKTVTIGALYTPSSVAVTDANFRDAMLGDVNKDGIPDLITLDNGSPEVIKVFLGNGDGTFNSSATATINMPSGYTFTLAGYNHAAFLADVNDDGNMDIVALAAGSTLGGPVVILGNGNGTFKTPSSPTGFAGTTLVAANFDGSGNADFVQNNSTLSSLTEYFGLNTGKFTTAYVQTGQSPMGVAVGDFNGDGITDIVVSDSGGTGILLGLGGGSFGAETYFSTKYVSQLAVADLNGDGKQDVLLSNASGIYVYLGNGNGTFQAASQVTTNSPSAFAGPIVLGDYNGDGIPDIATFVDNGTVETYLNNGDGTFSLGVVFTASVTGVLTADLNGDGASDIVTTNTGSSGGVTVWVNVKPKLSPTITVTGATVTFDAQLHPATVNATGARGVNLNSLLTVYYVNLATRTFSTTPEFGGTYEITLSFAGNSAYNAVPYYDSDQQVVINPAPGVQFVFSSATVPADGLPHTIPFAATSPYTAYLNPYVTFKYQNKATGVTTVTAPSQPGTYEVFANFLGDQDNLYLPFFDTDKTLTITAPKTLPGGTILSDTFTNSGGPYGTTAYSNGAAINGQSPDSLDLSGGKYTYFSTVSTYGGGVISTAVGNAGSSVEVGPQSALALPLNGSGGGYTEPTVLKLSADIEVYTLAGSDKNIRGIALGLSATAPIGVATDGSPINNGVLFNTTNGALSLISNNGATITPLTLYDPTGLGAFSTTHFYHLSYTIDTSTGLISNLTLSDSIGSDTFAAGTLSGFVTGTGSPASTANYLTVSASGNNGSEFGYVDNLTVSVPSTVAVAPPTASPGAPTSISSGAAALNGIVNPQGSSTTASIQYSTSPVFAPSVQTTLASGFNGLNCVAVDAVGNAYITDFSANTVEKISPTGTVTMIGSGWNGPADVAVDNLGDVFVAEFFNSDVKEVTPSGAILTVGSGFSEPNGVAVDNSGNVYVTNNGFVQKVAPNGTITNVSSFSGPSGLALDAAGDLFVSDLNTNAVYEVLAGTNTAVTLATGFSRPQNIAVDSAGDVYVADFYNNVVKEILPGGTVQTVGSGFSNPIGVAVDAAGDLLVAGNGNHALFKLAPASIAPVVSTLSGSSSLPVFATVTGLTAGTQYYYRVVGQSAGGIVAGSTGTFFTLAAGKSNTGAVILDDTFTDAGTGPYTNGAVITTNKPDIADLPGSSYTYFSTFYPYPGGTIVTGVGNSGSAVSVGPQSNIVASLQSGSTYAEPSVLTLSVDLEMHTIAGSDELSRGIGLGLNAFVPNSFPNNLNPINNGVLVNAATGNLYFTASNGSVITAITGGTYNSTLLGTFSANKFYTLTFTVNTATGVVTNLSLSDSQGAEIIASPGTLAGFVTGTGTSTSTANYVDVSSNANSGGATGYIDNLIVSVAAAPIATSGATTSVTTSGATFNGTVNAQGSSTTNSFQYSTDPTFSTPTQFTTAVPYVPGRDPNSVAVDSAGDIYYTDDESDSVWEALPNGTTNLLASGVSEPLGIAVNAAGDVYFTDGAHGQVKEIEPGGTIITIASGFSLPWGIAVDGSGDIYVADYSANSVTEILPSGSRLDIGGFQAATAVAVDNAGDVFVTSNFNGIDGTAYERLADGTVRTIGSGYQTALGIAVNNAGDVFVSDANGHYVHEIFPNGNSVTITTPGMLGTPGDLATDPLGDLFVSDLGIPDIAELSAPTIAATPGTSTGTTATTITAATGLSTNTLYYYRAVVQGIGGTSVGITDGVIVAPTAGSGINANSQPALNLVAGESISLGTAAATSDRTVLTTSSLTIAASAQLNLGGNDLIIHNNPSLTSITGLLQAGYNGGAWNGPGIDSAAAQTNNQHLTALGVAPVTTAGTFDGQTVAVGDVLVKYTYYGDANLDGRVDGSDYTKIDAGFNSHGAVSGWSNGDFNYDGKIDGSDYTLIDNAFNTQGANITAQIAALVRSGQTNNKGASSYLQPARPDVFNSSTPISFATAGSTTVESSLKKQDRLDDLVSL